VRVPGFIVVACAIAEGAKDAFEVMLILQADMLLDNCDTRRLLSLGEEMVAIFTLPARGFCECGFYRK
jgi:hypothetical protein